MIQTASSIGELVRTWREKRRLSQLDLATEAEISQKHLSFIESGRSAPSREMVLHLAEQLDVPLRDRNVMLLAAGFAPVFGHRPLNDPALAPALASIGRLLKAHEPYPAFTVDRHWNMVSANAAVPPLLGAVDPELMKPPINILRASLHPRGLAPLIVNLGEWRAHLLDRLRRQLRITRDPVLHALLRELVAYQPSVAPAAASQFRGSIEDVAMPLQMRTHHGVLSFLSTVTVFGTATEITLSELSLEALYPADRETSIALNTGQVR